MDSSDDYSESSGRKGVEGRFVRTISILACVGLIFFIGMWFGFSSKSRHDNHVLGSTDRPAHESHEKSGTLIPPSGTEPSGPEAETTSGAGGSGLFKDNTIANIFKQASPAVVTIDAVPATTVSTSANDVTPKIMPSPLRMRRMIGAGVVVSPDGYIVTCAHLLRPGANIKVTQTAPVKRTTIAKVLGIDAFTDLALLKVDGSELPCARLGNSDKLQVGDWVVAIGNPFGFDHTVTFGIISALGRSLDDLNNHAELIQTDAGINTGNSGGPLLNIKGEVIGIVVAVRTDAQGIAFACPVNTVKRVAEDLKAHGSIARPFLGLIMKDIDPIMAKNLNLPSSTGVLIAETTNRGPCQAAGIMPNDVLQSFDGVQVVSVKQVREIIASHKPGDQIVLGIKRQSGTEMRKITVGAYAQ